MIRDAKFGDIPAIVSLLHGAFERSVYAKEKLGAIDVKVAKNLLLTAIQRHGNTHGGATWIQVAETGGMITGLIVGTLSRVYAIGDKLMATDIFWVANGLVDPADPIALMRGMIGWAKSCPDVIEIKLGTTAVINDDPKEAGRVLQRLGLQHYGEIYREVVK